MGRTARARHIVAGAAYGGGGAVGVLGGTLGLLWAQTLLARHRVGEPRGVPFVVDGRYLPVGGGELGRPHRMAWLGDSGGAGLGAARPRETPAVVVAERLADSSGGPVDLVNVSVVGARTSDLPAQVERVATAFGGAGPDVAVVMVGANDVTHAVRPQVSVRWLTTVIGALRDGGAEVVVVCCPDLGTVEPVPNPLRAVGRRRSRTLAAAQGLASAEAGAHPVALGALLGPEFASRPGEYFSEDRFHPSSVGYRRAADVILPSVLVALGWASPPEPPAPA